MSMTSLLNLDAQLNSHPEPAVAPPAVPAAVAGPDVAGIEDDGADFEIVFGRRQIASTSLVLLVTLAFFSGVSYLIGKSTAVATVVKAEPSKPAPVAELKPAPAEVKPVVEAPKAAALPPIPAPSAAELARANDSPVFAQPIPGQVYLQIGVVEKGVAAVWAEGLRTHGLNSFVATGPTDQWWRVEIGPLPSPEAYQHAKDTLDRLQIPTFGRRYQPQ